jgi:hypothetical protein
MGVEVETRLTVKGIPILSFAKGKTIINIWVHTFLWSKDFTKNWFMVTGQPRLLNGLSCQN